jgi:hypothetical protein
MINLNTGGGGGAEEETCASSTTEAEPVPANLLFVIDSSGSMNCNPPDGDAELGARCARYPVQEDPNRPTKWQVVRAALETTLAALTDQPRLSAGLALFPSGSECGVSSTPSVPIATLDTVHVGKISEALASVAPDGETPLVGGTILSYAHLAEELRARNLGGNSFVILLTDGAETCAPSLLDQLVTEDVPNARLFDIRTFVIGAPGSESARGLLSRVAFEGGTARSEDCDHGDLQSSSGDCHFDMTASRDFGAELAATLGAITAAEAISCTLAVPHSPGGGEVDLDKVNVKFTPAEGEPIDILNDTTSGCADGADGWQYSADRSQILLCGEACGRVRATRGELRIVLGCPTVTVR